MHAGIPPPSWQGDPPGKADPRTVHAGRYGQQVGGMHPTGMQSCLLLFLKNCMEMKEFGPRGGALLPCPLWILH